MVFKKMCLEVGTYGEDDVKIIKKLVKKRCNLDTGPLSDV